MSGRGPSSVSTSDLLQPDRVAGEVGHARDRLRTGVISSLNSPACDRRDRLLVRGQRERVLVLARDLPFLGDLLGGDAHAVGDGDVLVAANTLRAQRDLVAHHRHHRHRLGAAGEHQVGLAEADAVGRQRHRLQAGRAEAVDGLRGDRVRAGRRAARRCAPRSCPARPRASRSRRSRRRCGSTSMPGACATTAAQHVREHVVGTGVAEHAARRLADRGAGGGDDVGVLDLLGSCSCPVSSSLSSAAACRS